MYRIFLLESIPSESLVMSGNKVIATSEDFSSLIAMLEKGETGLQFIPLLPKNEQEKIYLKFVDDYIVSNYLIKKIRTSCLMSHQHLTVTIQ